MSNSATYRFGDAELIAYLDGRLDESRRQAIEEALKDNSALQFRLRELDINTLQIRDAFDSVLVNAPKTDLPPAAPAMTRQAVHVDPVDPVRVSKPGKWRWAIAACLMVAVAAGWFARGAIEGVDETTPPWQVAVADYQRLYTMETLGTAQPDPLQVAQQLDRVSQNSGLTVTTEMVDIPGLTFRRAQTLGIDGQPLIQMAFATAQGAPVALCFTRDKATADTIASNTIAGLNSSSWGNGEFGFIIIGDVPQKLLDTSARLMAPRFL